MIVPLLQLSEFYGNIRSDTSSLSSNLMKKLIISTCLIAAIFLTTTDKLNATIITANDGLGRIAEANFSVTGTVLTVTLTNKATADVLIPTFILSGLLWNLVDGVGLAPVSAAITPTSSFVYTAGNGLVAGTGTAGDIAGEWAYRNSANFATFSSSAFSYGLGTAGFSPSNLFGNGDLISANDRNNKQGPNGIDFAIVSSSDNLATGNGGVTGAVLIQGAAVFVFNLPVNYVWSDANIASVSFLYGTGTGTADPQNPLLPPNETGVPEPGTFGMMGLAGLLILAKKLRG